MATSPAAPLVGRFSLDGTVMNLAMLLAVTAPCLLPHHDSLTATLMQQLLAVAGWGLVLSVHRRRVRAVAWGSVLPLLLVLAVLLAACVAACVAGWAWQGLPLSLALCWLGTLLACLAVLWISQRATPADIEQGLAAFMNAVLVAGVASALIAVVQVFLPLAADDVWVASSNLPGRAVGNMRQPNLLSDLLCWSLVAWVVVADPRGRAPLRPLVATGVGLLLILGMVLSGSRSAAVGLLGVALWAAVDRSLLPVMRRAMLLAPLGFAGLWLLVSGWASWSDHSFGGLQRLAETDLSGSRFALWRNCVQLLAAQPWSGVGLSEFNLAWTLTPLSGRAAHFFDHSHNLPLQWAVELGIPLGSLLVLACVLSLWQAFRRCQTVPGQVGLARRAGLLMVLLMAAFSLLEYPLWYAYFSLPTVWLLGVALRQPAPDLMPLPQHAPTLVCGLAMTCLAALAAADYARVANIYRFGTGVPTDQRIDAALDSVLFSHWAAYAKATMQPKPGMPPPSPALFVQAAHSLVDTRLLKQWALALNATGQPDQARYLAARLREFRHDEDADFFAVCDRPALADSARPFQCEPPVRPWTWKDFRHPPPTR